MAPPAGFEPATSGLEGHCSIRAELRGRVTQRGYRGLQIPLGAGIALRAGRRPGPRRPWVGLASGLNRDSIGLQPCARDPGATHTVDHMKRQYGTGSITWLSEGKAKLLPARRRRRLGPGNCPHRFPVSAHQHRAPPAERDRRVRVHRPLPGGCRLPGGVHDGPPRIRELQLGYRRISTANSTTSATKST